MSLNSARPNTWMAVSVDPASELSYAPQVNPSPLTVGSGKGSLEIVITNATNADINVMHVVFTIKVAPIANNDGNALTSTTADIKTAVSDQNWTVVKPAAPVSSGPANYTLQPMVGHYLPLLKGRSIVVQIYGFPTNTTAGTSTIEIKEVIGTTLPGKIAHPHFTVTTFPWGFAFSDLAANVPDGSGWKPVAQVENGQIVTLFWHGSVVDTGSYTIYYSNSQGQQTATPTRLGQWRSPALTEDTVFTLGVVTNNSVGEKLKASMSVAVAVRNPDLVAKSVKAQTAAVGFATITNLEVLTTTTLKGDLNVGLAASRSNLTVYSSPLVIDAGDRGVITGNRLTFGAGTNTLVVDKTQGLSVTGYLRVTGLLSLTSGLKMSDTNAVIQRGDGNITVGDLGLYSNIPAKWMRLVTNNSPILFFTDGGNGTNPALTINSDGTLDVQGASSTPSTLLRLSNHVYTGISNYDNNAEISNDITNSYGKALMLNGNSSRNPGIKTRWVQVWDNLEVKNNLYVTGEIYKYWTDTHRYEFLGGDGGSRSCEWHAPSDLRLKRDVEPVPSALDKVRHLRGVTFYWNEDALQHFTRNIETTLSAGPNATESESQKFWQEEREKQRNQLSTTQVGVLAQDVEAVLPEAVTTDADGYKTVRYDNLIPLLIEAIKEHDQLAARQQAEIERLKLAVGIGE